MMKVRQPGAWRRILALAPVLLLVVSLPSQVLLRCRMDGQLRAECCCPGEQKSAAAPAHAMIASRCCCDREVSSRDLPTVRTAPAADWVPTVTVVLVPFPVLREGEPGSASRVVRQSYPAREGPQILLLKQAFLI
jgi:hypothetical protein